MQLASVLKVITRGFSHIQRTFSRDTGSISKVTFATTVWEKDWRHILLSPNYLQKLQIENHCFPFAEKLLIINNVENVSEVRALAARFVEEGVLTRVLVVADIEHELLAFYQLQRTDFRPDAGIHPDWVYYNALGPLAAIYACQSAYCLYLTGDVKLLQPLSWIEQAIDAMEKNPQFAVAGLVWNDRYNEAKRESISKKGPFWVANEGFSDQLFLVKREIFRQPIYGEIRPDAAHFPRGDVFEKRVFSVMKNKRWKRLIYRHGSYTHENF